jgi:2-polyprenyl-3-methyl-5-hydroxy-6-metoxy-1,4-benzoquinol methylase
MSNDIIKEAEKFYNEFSPKLVKDYLLGNPRIEAAIKHTLTFLNKFSSKKILDIGCGLGWSSYEYAKHFPCAEVLAIDLSSELIKSANDLFSSNNLKYVVQNITAKEFAEFEKFDAIVLLDVYEHIPSEMRKAFNLALNNILKEDGVVILTCPSVYHQNFLREYDVAGLQPVDEDITLTTMQELAKDINAEVCFFSFNTIFRQNDYTYTVLKKGLLLQDKIKNIPAFNIRLDEKNIRYKRILESRFKDIAKNLPLKKESKLKKLKKLLGS